MGHRPAFAGLERHAGFGAVEGLNLAFLVDRDEGQQIGCQADTRSEYHPYLPASGPFPQQLPTHYRRLGS
jgi:hypothetical protein